MQTLARALLGFAVLVAVASVVIVAATVYSSGGPKGEEQPFQIVPAEGGS